MTDFNENEHPRTTDGTFAIKGQTAPETELTRHGLSAGMRVTVDLRAGTVTRVDGDTCVIEYPNGDQALEDEKDVEPVDEPDEVRGDRQVAAQAIVGIRKSLREGQEKFGDLAWVQRAINDGAWSDLRDTAVVGLIDTGANGYRDVWLDEHAAEINDLSIAERRALEPDAAKAFDIAETTAEAVSARHLIGSVDGWTQEAYDHLTRPWRVTYGSIHPDDEVSPESWGKRSIPTLAARQVFLNDLEKINAEIRGRDALIHFEDGFDGIDEEKLGPDLSRAYSNLTSYGYANSLL